jgi:ATP-binding cassette, subfamily B, multidrug efflux pump
MAVYSKCMFINRMLDRLMGWFERRLDPYPDHPVAPPPAGLVPFIWHYAKPAWPLVLTFSLASALIAVVDVTIYGFTGAFVDWLATQDRVNFLSENGWAMAAGVFGLVVLVPLLHFIWELLFHQSYAANFPMMIRWKAHRYLLGQSLSFFQNDMAGRIATTVMQTSLSIREAISKLFEVMVYFGVYVISALVLLASADLWLALPMLAWLLAYLATASYFLPQLGKISQAQADARSIMTGRVIDSYTNILTVKLFAHSAAESRYAKESMDPFLGTVHQQMRVVTKLNTVLNFLNYALLAAVIVLSAMLWQQSLVTIGSIAVAIGLVMRMHGMSQWILWEVGALFEAIGTIRDGIATLAKPITLLDKKEAGTLSGTKGEIVFKSVSFGYGKPVPAVENLNLTISAGEKVGIVGRSGAGKSTLVNLLLRLYDPEHGTILIDGQDIAAVTQESLRAKIGMVTQDTALLHRSVADNIRYGRPDAGMDAILAAASAAHAEDFIPTLEDGKGRKGYEAHVGERGVKLSGGQRQRVAIARVFLKNAPILVLDEATSALDSEVEAAIQDNLDDLTRGKTVLAIAHRLSTIAQMDRLIVMDKGHVVEDGTHAELVAKGGIYADLWARQSGGFLAHDGALAEAAE